jgi:dolichyl-phosphate beta-glucosyltransferase
MEEGRGGSFLSTSIVLPVAEGDRGIGALMTAVRVFARALEGPVEVVVVDDGTHDGLQSHVARWRAQFTGLAVARHESARGRGAAVRTGVIGARGEFGLVVDPDLAVPVDNAEVLLESLKAGADVALVSRGAEDMAATNDKRSFLERAADTTVMRLSQMMVPVGPRDCFAGLVALRSRAAKKIAQRSQVTSTAWVVEWLALAQYLGFQVADCEQTFVRGPLLGDRRTRGTRPFELLKDVWATRKRLASDEYSRANPQATLLSGTSFHKLDRDAPGVKKR